MKISVTNAQAMIHTLQAGVDLAMANGETEFDFEAAVEADEDAARASLAAAIQRAEAATAEAAAQKATAKDSAEKSSG